jgi:hypothetical protein
MSPRGSPTCGLPTTHSHGPATPTSRSPACASTRRNAGASATLRSSFCSGPEDHHDPLTDLDAIAAAELHIRAEKARRDPSTSTEDLIAITKRADEAAKPFMPTELRLDMTQARQIASSVARTAPGQPERIPPGNPFPSPTVGSASGISALSRGSRLASHEFVFVVVRDAEPQPFIEATRRVDFGDPKRDRLRLLLRLVHDDLHDTGADALPLERRIKINLQPFASLE